MKKRLFLPFPTRWSYPEPFHVYLTHSFRDILSPLESQNFHHLSVTGLQQLLWGDLCRNFLLHYIPGTTGLGDCESSAIPALLFHPVSIPASWLKYYSRFSCTHASTASTKANQITREVSVWAYQQPTENVSAAVFYPSFSWKMFHHTFCGDPVGNLLNIFQRSVKYVYHNL